MLARRLRRSSGTTRCGWSPTGWDCTADLAPRTDRADPPQGGRAEASATRIRRTPWEHDERLFLAMCLALPERAARILLGDLDVAHFADASHWEAATYIRRACWRVKSTPEEAHTVGTADGGTERAGGAGG